ncbi:chemotaxis protein CheW [Bacillus pumilus]|uniref:Chemotaxis protein n=1 Tax=Bacillus pumilus (strain SAFR-032) TaxID=315750 RepID=A8FEY1_BACP2|nr:chemotaxis protein CheW [Bacillus pumilus]ABV62798.1 chemotaxis protein [Bacillus pumilus SAFR-032]MBC3641952.1 purine-binding chemotaxis protein CheW [Bacillus pumilus]MBC3644943.1 purine-binding chemotaxis protein CheW [Bacillus pumilus]MBC3649476.1 purine-binding chemotaxis protein CheW [Bacillus pumilus]MBC3652911.1 purine-binding chemotaxis protein CheW [Bacillus pumilus]
MSTQKIIIFQVGQEDFGISVEHIRSIEKVPYLQEVSNLPKEIKGLMSLRGEVIPVSDTGVMLHGKPLDVNEQSKVLLFELNEQMVGCLVSGAKDIIDIELSEIKPFHMNTKASEYFFGVVERENKMILQVDPNKFLGRIEDLDQLPARLKEELA